MLFCNKENCIYRSKRPSQYTSNDKVLYKCKCSKVIIDNFIDGDRGIYLPDENSCMCLMFKEEINDNNKNR